MGLPEFIREKRPKITESSVKTYCSVLRTFYRKAFPDDEHFDAEKFETEQKHVLDVLADIPYNKRKTIIAAIVVITDGNAAYRNIMMSDIKRIEKETAKQELTEKQKANWITPLEINDKLVELAAEFKLMSAKSHIGVTELQRAQPYIMLALYSGKFVPPRRSTDYIMKIGGDINPTADNYIDKKKKQFVFNRFKTVKTHGQERTEIPPELWKILSKWMAMNSSEYLLTDRKGKPLSNVTLNQRINKLFPGKPNVGVNGFRKSFLTSKFGDMIERNKELGDTMKEMGSSAAVATSYIKNVDEE